MTYVCIFNNLYSKSLTEQEWGRYTRTIIRAGVWSLTINKSQTVFDDCRQVVNKILFLIYIYIYTDSTTLSGNSVTSNYSEIGKMDFTVVYAVK